MPEPIGHSDEGMFGSIETVGTAGVFGQVMGLVAVTLCLFTLRSYLGREVTEGASIICFIGGFICIVGLNFARRSEVMSITSLFAAGLLVSIPGGNAIYALLGLCIFGGYTVLDFNRMRRAGMQEAVPLAAGIFQDVINIFLFFLRLFSGRD